MNELLLIFFFVVLSAYAFVYYWKTASSDSDLLCFTANLAMITRPTAVIYTKNGRFEDSKCFIFLQK